MGGKIKLVGHSSILGVKNRTQVGAWVFGWGELGGKRWDGGIGSLLYVQVEEQAGLSEPMQLFCFLSRWEMGNSVINGQGAGGRSGEDNEK